MAPFRKVVPIPEFKKDFKNLKKKWRTLDNDLEIFINTALKAFHKLGQDNVGIVRIPGLGFESPAIYKARKFACRSLKGTGANSGIRIIYAYHEREDKIEFIEIYYKGDKANENRERIKSYSGEKQNN